MFRTAEIVFAEAINVTALVSQGLELVLHSDDKLPVLGVVPGGINQQRQQLFALILRPVNGLEVVAQLIGTAQFKFRACHCLPVLAMNGGKSRRHLVLTWRFADGLWQRR